MKANVVKESDRLLRVDSEMLRYWSFTQLILLSNLDEQTRTDDLCHDTIVIVKRKQ